jgi:DNA-binding transcriptional MerR regulator
MKAHEQEERTPSAVGLDNGHDRTGTRYTVDEVASRLRVSPRRIHALVRSGQLACVQVTPRTRIFTEEQIAAFERARTVSALPTTIPATAPKIVDNRASRVAPSRATPSNKLATRERRAERHEAVSGVKSNGEKLDKASLRKEMSSWR